jgi:hypothetical protein
MIADYDSWRATGLIFLRSKFSSQRQFHSERTEEPGRDLAVFDVRSCTRVREVNSLLSKCRKLLKGASASLPILEVWI